MIFGLRRSIIPAVEAVMMVMMVMVVVIISAIPGHHDHARIEAVMMMMPVKAMVMVVMMVELSHLDVFGRLSWRGFVDGLKQRYGVRNRLQQFGV